MAESLFLHTPLRIKEISENIGFLNSTYFITVFKKKYGVSPNQYRQMKRAN
ncbi:AraC family transcriptional regulator [Paenibacillus sp. PL91]|uniref:AraC family transcriptional regulator n=1 Tax=Paenibacillus sp. PL91 TaxID=2729538 RepID=UPI00145F0350|nr:AraC family transcriptional regulator [Paenibacillus sp. PL91]MBC9200819.1 helix-turn-helix transcriptional regulator [Paenibacillus sp. PL91]